MFALRIPDLGNVDGRPDMEKCAACGSKCWSMRTVALVLLFSASCFAQSIRVRVVNDKNGRPLPNQAVYVQFVYQSPAIAAPKLHSDTDSNGEAEFSIPPLISVPKRLYVAVAIDSQHWRCDCTLVTDVESVIKNGVIQTREPKTSITQTKLPGLIVFHAHPFTLLDKILWAVFRGEL